MLQRLREDTNEFQAAARAKFGYPIALMLNWKWIDITIAGLFTAHYCYEGKCIELGEFESADSANFAVLKEIRRCINTGVSRLVKD